MGLISRNVPFSQVYLAVLAFFVLGLFASRAIMIHNSNSNY